MNPGRINRVKAWLLSIQNDLDDIGIIFTENLISKDEIGYERYRIIESDINEIARTIDDILAELDNYGMVINNNNTDDTEEMEG